MPIDLHAHIALTDPVNAAMQAVYPEVPGVGTDFPGYCWTYSDGTVYGPIPDGLFDLAPRLEHMDETGIDRQAIALRPKAFHYMMPVAVAAELCKIQNDGLAAFAAGSPNRLTGMAALPMQDLDAAVAEIERLSSIETIGGINLEANLGGANLDGPEFEQVWAALEAADMPIVVHPYQEHPAGVWPRMEKDWLSNIIGNPMDTTVFIGRLIFSGIMDRYPKLRWCFVHGGGVAPSLIGRWDHGWEHIPRIGPDLANPPSSYLKKMWFDTITHSPRVLRSLAEQVGWDRIVIGTDYPWPMGVADPVAQVGALGLGPEERTMVTDTNAKAFLGTP